MKNFLDISDLSSQALRGIIEEAKKRKSSRNDLNKSDPDNDKPFYGRSMIMIFEKPSTRTRISFDIVHLAPIVWSAPIVHLAPIGWLNSMSAEGEEDNEFNEGDEGNKGNEGSRKET